ncbi:MAG TPA: putative sulfate exporter family transporter [Candidatus Binatia bacterium]|nr:putative sulfate exporter family transporter [Candidatus Binatia bacterium]
MSESDYSWAAYLDYMEGGGSDVVSLPAAKPAPKQAFRADQPLWGILAAFTLSLIALWLGKLAFWPFTMTVIGGRVMHPIEPVMIAIVLGMAVSNLWKLPKAFQPGIKFSVKKLLPLGIVLLGARLNFGEMMKVGLAGLALSALETVLALSLLLLLARWLKLPPKLGTLLGVGTAICGGTAIVATAPVIEAEDKDVAFSVATITLLSLLAMFALPLMGHLLDLTSRQFGVWAGLAIHQTPQVVAAGYAYSPSHGEYSPVAGDTATIVKMARVCLLAPVVFIIGLFYARNKAQQSGVTGSKRINYLHLFPTFILGFVGMALLNTLGLLPELTVRHAGVLGQGVHTLAVAGAAEQASRFCIIISMAGVGLETKFAAMRQTGLRPFAASLLAMVLVAVVVLVLIKALGI